jgi:hypothetical protein
MFEKLAEIVNGEGSNIAFVLEYIQMIESFRWTIKDDLYRVQVAETLPRLLKLPELISDEELKSSTKDHFSNLLRQLRVYFWGSI